MKFFRIVVLLVLCGLQLVFPYTESPLIGIVSEPCLPGVCGGPDTSYIAASYVKFVEMGGGRAVPLVYNENKPELLRRLKSVRILSFSWFRRAAPTLFFEQRECVGVHSHPR